MIRDKALSSGNSDASHPDTIKACLLAGATKDEFPNWSQTEARPLDSTFGAGELNIYNSYRIIEEAESSTGNVSHRGWARNSVTTSGNPNNQVRTYTFTTPNYPAGEIRLSAALIWQREVSNITYSYQSLDNLRLELLDSGDSLIQASDSSEDNVEHIWNTGLQPNTTYSLQVTSNSGESSFSLAWHVDFAPANPVLTALSRNPSDIQLSFLNLQPNLDYYVQRSTTFSETSWSNIAPLVPTTSSDSYTDNSPPGTDKVFYRLLPLLP
ncbi:hypothetical protein SAMN02745181_2603 [Rubritalea squalenifaciens DSM 18772]|uniref:Uncharacterized protein n=1 Tax=Rubritalea squalenifaciens DSM 18772 TaxID=1123071 RepID=A0A1M6M4K4_9BACT|nr:hypothetical protein [Rubritalea squalenifaciens]SHJ78414.1 hypothetical protein SAMN02745181_2603 [Rubritalea squalenifaciens DSM 18772]